MRDDRATLAQIIEAAQTLTGEELLALRQALPPVAGPWSQASTGHYRPDLNWDAGATGVAAGVSYSGTTEHTVRGGKPWLHAWCDIDSHNVPLGQFPTVEAAKAACDDCLRKHGWRLCGPPHADEFVESMTPEQQAMLAQPLTEAQEKALGEMHERLRERMRKEGEGQ